MRGASHECDPKTRVDLIDHSAVGDGRAGFYAAALPYFRPYSPYGSERPWLAVTEKGRWQRVRDGLLSFRARCACRGDRGGGRSGLALLRQSLASIAPPAFTAAADLRSALSVAPGDRLVRAAIRREPQSSLEGLSVVHRVAFRRTTWPSFQPLRTRLLGRLEHERGTAHRQPLLPPSAHSCSNHVRGTRAARAGCASCRRGR
jgi:hypothetical protein